MRKSTLLAVFFLLLVPVSALGKQQPNTECVPAERPWHAFHWDDFVFELGKKYPSYPPLEQVNAAEGRLAGRLFGLPSLVTGVTGAFGACDWWPDRLAMPFGFRNQVLMEKLDTGTWTARVAGSQWGLQFEPIRYYLDPSWLGLDGDSHAYLSFMNTHWSGRPGKVSEEEFNLLEYAARNDIDISNLNTIDVVSLQFAQHSLHFDSRLDVEYRIGWNLFQAPPDKMFQGLWDPNERRSYEFPFMTQGRLSFAVGPNADLFAGWAAELSRDKQPNMTELGISTHILGKETHGMALAHQWYRGIPRRAIQSTQFGAWIQSEMTVIRLWARAF